MTPEEEYQRLAEAFAVAVELSGEQRAEYLAEVGRDHLTRRVQLEAMLRCDATATDAPPAHNSDVPDSGGDDSGGDDSGGRRTLAQAELAGARSDRTLPGATGKFAGYELIEEIGRGGMGVVFRARQQHPRRIVALKMIRSGQFASETDLQRFATEAETTANLDHDGVVPIYEVGQYDGEPFYTMKFVDGDSLAWHLADGSFGRDQQLAMMIEICRAIDHCHDRGVVHRDLKPSNILIDRDGRPRVTDFGLAKYLHNDSTLTVAGDILGTPGYMSPEQAMGDSSRVGPPADVYALGAILYRMLTGHPPIHAEDVNLAGALRLIREHDVVPPRGIDRHIPRALDTVCMKCLETDPGKRYPTAGELADELERFRDGEPIRAEPLSFMRRLSRWARQQPGLAVTWLAVGVFYTYHLVCHYLLAWSELTPTFHYVTTAVVAVWAVGAWLCQRGLLLTGGRLVYVYIWATLDVVLVTILLAAGTGAKSPLAVLYHVLIAGAVLRFSVPLVTFVTLLSLAGYLSQVLRGVWWQPELLPTAETAMPFALSLLTLGLIQHLALRRSRAAYEAVGKHRTRP